MSNELCGQIWPLVKLAKVCGPWRILSSGIVFVDLPGVGDSNAVRNKIAAREWNRADFACICMRIERAVTDKESVEWLEKGPAGVRNGPGRAKIQRFWKWNRIISQPQLRAQPLPRMQKISARSEPFHLQKKNDVMNEVGVLEANGILLIPIAVLFWGSATTTSTIISAML